MLRALFRHRRLTRAELTVQAKVSKPTASQSIRRLEAAGVVRDTGERTTGRGRVGSYYAPSVDVGVALALEIAPVGVSAERIDVFGDTTATFTCGIDRPASPEAVATSVRAATAAVLQGAPGPVRATVVSAADPVDRVTGRLVHLPDTPFLIGDLDPSVVLAGLVPAPVLVDNDVNWAARAEGGQRQPPLEDFVYLYLDEGLGAAVVADGQVRRGHSGLAGEIAHLMTCGPDGRAVWFTQVFAELGLRRPGGTALEVEAVLSVLADPTGQACRSLVSGLSGVLAAIVSLADPGIVVLGGRWGRHPQLLRSLQAEMARSARPVRLCPAQVERPALTGARAQALADLRAAIVAGLG